MTPLNDLWEHGQSPWLDNLRRDWIEDGGLQHWIDSGIRGLTSNPSIFQNAIAGSDAYDEQFRALVNEGSTIVDAYWKLVTTDIENALRLLRPVYDASGGTDGFVSVEVDPSLAHDTAATTAAARELAQTIDEPNLLVKIPGTEAGLPSIKQMTAEGHSINVTLIFSVDRYRDVMESYISGLETESASGDLSAHHRRCFILHQPRRHRDRPLLGRHRFHRGPVVARDRCHRPGPKLHTAHLSRRSRDLGGKPSRREAPRFSGRCGLRRQPRILRIPTRST